MANDEVVVVEIEVGHDSEILPKPTANGQTHNWKVFVRGKNSKDISSFVESIEFKHHVRSSDFSFLKIYQTEKVVKHPFEVKEKGFAGLQIPIKINFRNEIQVDFIYNLYLSQGSQQDSKRICSADSRMSFWRLRRKF